MVDYYLRILPQTILISVVNRLLGYPIYYLSRQRTCFFVVTLNCQSYRLRATYSISTLLKTIDNILIAIVTSF